VKRIIAVCFAGLLLFAGAASAATPAQRIASLEKQVKSLTATVKKQQAVISCIAKSNNKCVTLKSTVNTLGNAVDVSLAIEFCIIGATADALQSTWTTLDQANHTTLFGSQQTISDADACSALQIHRQGIIQPPTTSVFSALVALVSRTKAFRFG
jgi:hypothetical protein